MQLVNLRNPTKPRPIKHCQSNMKVDEKRGTFNNSFVSNIWSFNLVFLLHEGDEIPLYI